MFDHHHYYKTSIDSHSTVTEKRAPTDESIRLLKEMEQAATQKVTNAIRLTDMGVECVIHSYEDHLNQQIHFCVMFSLSGKKMTADVRLNGFDISTEDIAKALIKEVSETIAIEMLAPAFNKIPNYIKSGWGSK